MNSYPTCLPLGFGDSSSSDESINGDFNWDFNSASNKCSYMGPKTNGRQNNGFEVVQRLEEAGGPIIDFMDSGGSLATNNRRPNFVIANKDNANGLTNDYPPNSLPKKSISYDYIRQPLGIKEQNREFLPMVGNLSSPFLRPILIDGIGLIKAYWEGCGEEDPDGAALNCFERETKIFPMVPIIRCLFYWISRGHLAKVCFPTNFNPITDRAKFGAIDEHLINLKSLECVKIAKYFDGENFHSCISDKHLSMRACIVTSVHHWISGNHLDLNMHDSDEYKTWNEVHQTSSSDHILQPYFGPKGDFVYFSPIRGAKKEFTVDTVLDNEIKTQEEFVHYYPFQLNFIDQAKQLKVLYDLLPKERRMREAHVMMAILERINKFL